MYTYFDYNIWVNPIRAFFAQFGSILVERREFTGYTKARKWKVNKNKKPAKESQGVKWKKWYVIFTKRKKVKKAQKKTHSTGKNTKLREAATAVAGVYRIGTQPDNRCLGQGKNRAQADIKGVAAISNKYGRRSFTLSVLRPAKPLGLPSGIALSCLQIQILLPIKRPLMPHYWNIRTHGHSKSAETC